MGAVARMRAEMESYLSEARRIAAGARQLAEETREPGVAEVARAIASDYEAFVDEYEPKLRELNS